MSSVENVVKCPKCGCEIDINNAISHRLEEEFRAKSEAEQKRFEEQRIVLEQEKNEFENKKKKENELFQERLESKLKEQKNALEAQLKDKLKLEQEEQFSLLKKELEEKSEQVKEFNRAKATIEMLKREKDELREAIELENQTKLNEQIKSERERIQKIESEKNEMLVLELKKQLEDQKKLTEEMSRKHQQGSMQLQGEVQELAIEEWLKTNFPLDRIDEVKKGVRGADCIQVVNTYTAQDCGVIYYESKRTKDFQPTWIKKFKDDMREFGAGLGVLVTDVLPKGMERMGLLEGIWICTYQEFKGLCFVLRENVIAIHNATATQENKGDKMTMLYSYLTSNEFKSQVEAIVEGFSQMQADLIKERTYITNQWKQREKMIQKVLLNTTYMYGSVKGIAGSAIQPIQSLELPENTVDSDDL